MTFYGDYYELPYFAECDECGSIMDEPECSVCMEADYAEDLGDAA